MVASNGISSSSPPARPANNTSGRQQARLRGDVARITLSPPQRNVHTILLLRSPIASCPLAVPEQCSDCFFPCIRPACVAIGNITSLPTETPCEFRNIAPYRFSTSDEPAETVPATGTRVSSRLVKGTDVSCARPFTRVGRRSLSGRLFFIFFPAPRSILYIYIYYYVITSSARPYISQYTWIFFDEFFFFLPPQLWPSRRKRTTFANHFIIVPASQRGDTIYMKFLDTGKCVRQQSMVRECLFVVSTWRAREFRRQLTLNTRVADVCRLVFYKYVNRGHITKSSLRHMFHVFALPSPSPLSLLGRTGMFFTQRA